MEKTIGYRLLLQNVSSLNKQFYFVIFIFEARCENNAIKYARSRTDGICLILENKNFPLIWFSIIDIT